MYKILMEFNRSIQQLTPPPPPFFLGLVCLLTLEINDYVKRKFKYRTQMFTIQKGSKEDFVQCFTHMLKQLYSVSFHKDLHSLNHFSQKHI
jgi:hypothetical protein